MRLGSFLVGLLELSPSQEWLTLDEFDREPILFVIALGIRLRSFFLIFDSNFFYVYLKIVIKNLSFCHIYIYIYKLF